MKKFPPATRSVTSKIVLYSVIILRERLFGLIVISYFI